MKELSLRALDEVSIELFAGQQPEQSLRGVRLLTPYMEWYWLKGAGHVLPELTAFGGLASMQSALRSNAASWVDDVSYPRSGYARVRREKAATEDVTWVSFVFSFRKAAEAAGLSRVLALQLAGVIHEMEDNIHHHSYRSRSGLVAFMCGDGVVEFVVLDRGVGVLASLRSSSEFAGLEDHGAALRTAIQTGKSRFGGAHGGEGFNTLVIGIANANAQIRFRSGDHLLELDGTTDAITAKAVQRADSTGFMIAVRMNI